MAVIKIFGLPQDFSDKQVLEQKLKDTIVDIVSRDPNSSAKILESIYIFFPADLGSNADRAIYIEIDGFHTFSMTIKGNLALMIANVTKKNLPNAYIECSVEACITGYERCIIKAHEKPSD